jgi:hypothetical protein
MLRDSRGLSMRCVRVYSLRVSKDRVVVLVGMGDSLRLGQMSTVERR